MSAPRFPTSPVPASRRAVDGTDATGGPPAPGGVDHPDECGAWLVAFVGAVVGLTVLYLAAHIVAAFFRLVAS